MVRANLSREFFSSSFRAISSSFTKFEPSIFEQKSVKTARNCSKMLELPIPSTARKSPKVHKVMNECLIVKEELILKAQNCTNETKINKIS